MSVLSLARKTIERLQEKPQPRKYPGVRAAMDGNTAVILCERESTDGAGAYPITPSTQMGEYWAEEAAKGHLNISADVMNCMDCHSPHASKDPKFFKNTVHPPFAARTCDDCHIVEKH